MKRLINHALLSKLSPIADPVITKAALPIIDEKWCAGRSVVVCHGPRSRRAPRKGSVAQAMAMAEAPTLE